MTRRLGIVSTIVGGVIVALLGATVVFRDTLATAVAERRIATAGLVCVPVAAHVPASFPPSTLQLAPMDCTSATGPLASIQFAQPLDIQLAGTRARAVTCAAIDVDLRAQHRQVTLNALGDLSHVVGLDQPAVDLVLDWAALAPLDLPPFSAAHAVVRRAGIRVMDMRDLRLWSQDGGRSMSATEVHVDKVAALGDATVSGHSTADLTAVTLLYGGQLRIEVTGRQLDSPQPSVDLTVGLGSMED